MRASDHDALLQGDTENPWPALSDLLAATTLIFLTLFAVVAVPSLQARGRMAQMESRLDTIETAMKAGNVDVSRVGDYVLARVGSDAIFGTDSASLTSLKKDGRDQLHALAVLLRGILGDIDQIQVVGHTDVSGGDAHNVELSSRRASTVAIFMIRAAGLPACKVTALGRGPFYPRHPAAQYRNRMKDDEDRRIEIEIRPALPGDSTQIRRGRECVETGGELSPRRR